MGCMFVGCSRKSIRHARGRCPETETGKETTSEGRRGAATEQRIVMEEIQRGVKRGAAEG